MASISYDDVFDKFIGSVTDYELTSMDTSDAYNLMAEHLRNAVSEPYVRRLFSSLEMDDATQTMKFELKLSVDAGADVEFITLALAKWMVYEWLHNQVRSKTNTMILLAGKEQRYYSQANHIAELRALQDDAYKEARNYIMDRGFIDNTYLRGGAQ